MIDEEAENIDISKMRNDLAIFDVGEKTIEEICNTASMCKTIFWNGPLGFMKLLLLIIQLI